MLNVIDHTESRWSRRYKSHGRENGASTYSKEIAEHHLPLWQESVSGLNVTVSTCPRMLNMEISGDLSVQYLHTYPYKDGLKDIHALDKQLKHQFDRRIYITAYKSLQIQAQVAGFEAWHIPMSVDTSRIAPVIPKEHMGERVAAYYGNVIGPKVDCYFTLRDQLADHGWALHRIVGPQRDSWHELLKYDYGVAVGRCALEMGHLGLRVMFGGAQFGGIATTEADRMIQLDTNCNGRVVTFDREIRACLDAWHLADPFTNDSANSKQRLAGYLETLGA